MKPDLRISIFRCDGPVKFPGANSDIQKYRVRRADFPVSGQNIPYSGDGCPNLLGE
jgi:hypothetical protein